MGFYHYYGTDDYKLAAVSFEEAVQCATDHLLPERHLENLEV